MSHKSVKYCTWLMVSILYILTDARFMFVLCGCVRIVLRILFLCSLCFFVLNTQFYKNLSTGLKDVVWKSVDEATEKVNK